MKIALKKLSAKWQPFCLRLSWLMLPRDRFIPLPLLPALLVPWVQFHHTYRCPGSRFHWRFSRCNSNLMENSPCCSSMTDHRVTTNFCACHDSRAVVACAKFCSDYFVRMEVRAKWIFHWIWIGMVKKTVQLASGAVFSLSKKGFHRRKKSLLT